MFLKKKFNDQEKNIFRKNTIQKNFSRKKKILEENFDNYLFHPKKLKKSVSNILEIGFGMGDNLIELSKKNPNKQIIGIEPFLNGVASVVYSCVKSNINNILLYSHPVQEFLENYKKIFFKEIFILFPDPWPKKKHLKRRLVQIPFIKILLERMEKNGKLYFATDNQNYFNEVQEHLNSDEIRKIPISIKKLDPNELILTKYFLRAKRLENKVSFLVIVKY